MKNDFLSKKIALGFDGFVDHIVKIVKNRKLGETPTYLHEVRELGEYILQKSQGNFALELDPVTTKLGGNMPIMAHALASLGFHPISVGAFGYPDIHPAFHPMAPSCQLYSFADPGLTTALEFTNGKLLLGEMRSLNDVRWDDLVDRIGSETVQNIFSETHLVALVNWSELEHATEIWEGVLNIMKGSSSESRPMIFFDLADCSRKDAGAIREIVQVMMLFKDVGHVALSLNRNETNLILSAVHPDAEAISSFEEKGKTIYRFIQPDYLVIRETGNTIIFYDNKSEHYPYQPIDNPAIKTGAGDHFNAGFCAGWLMEKPVGEMLRTGHTVAVHYMSTGQSPSLDKIQSYN